MKAEDGSGREAVSHEDGVMELMMGRRDEVQHLTVGVREVPQVGVVLPPAAGGGKKCSQKHGGSWDWLCAPYTPLPCVISVYREHSTLNCHCAQFSARSVVES